MSNTHPEFSNKQISSHDQLREEKIQNLSAKKRGP